MGWRLAFRLRLMSLSVKPARQSHNMFSVMVLHFLIQGRVQGVGFRWYVQREAGKLGLRGWVSNTEEGEV